MKYYRKTSHSRFDLKAHIVFCPKYRKNLLTGVLGQWLKEAIREICRQNEIEILGGKIAPDHIHLFVSYPPNLSVSQLVQQIKGKTSFKIFQEFQYLRKIFWGRHFWARGYMAVSSGNITDEVILNYLKLQEGEPIQETDLLLEA